jgi:hypothetical protein
VDHGTSDRRNQYVPIPLRSAYGPVIAVAIGLVLLVALKQCYKILGTDKTPLYILRAQITREEQFKQRRTHAALVNAGKIEKSGKIIQSDRRQLDAGPDDSSVPEKTNLRRSPDISISQQPLNEPDTRAPPSISTD